MADGVNVAQLMVTVGADTTMAVQGITGLASILGKEGLLAMAGVAAGAAIVGVGVMATKMAGDFQTSMVQLSTGAGEATAAIRPGGVVYNGILQMAKDTGTSTSQLADGMYMIGSAGYHGAQGLAILQAAAEGAKVGNADLGTTADALTTVMKNYPDVANGATGAMNTLIATVANGKTHMQDLATALSSVLPTARQAGIGLNDVMAAMAAQTAMGIPAADAATHLRQMIIALEAPSAAASQALNAIGLTTDQVATAMHSSLPAALELIQQHLAATYGQGTPAYLAALKNVSGGLREMQGMLALTGQNLGSFQADVGKISGAVKAGGTQVAGWNQVQGTFNQQLARFGEVAQTLMIQLGQKLLPVATQLFGFLADNAIPTIEKVTKFLTGNSTQSQVVRDTLIVLAVAISGALVAAFVAWAVAAGAAAIATLAATWPILAIGAGIALLVAGIIIAVQHWGDITNAAERFGQMITGVGITVGKFVDDAVARFNGFAGNILQVFLNLAFGVPHTMLQLGQDLMTNLAQGIAKGAASVTQALEKVPLLGGVTTDLTKILPHFAEGGTMAGAGFALVGESGPELVQLPGGAQITPIASGSGQSSIASLPAGLRQVYGAGSVSAGGGAQQPIVLQIDGRVVAQILLPYLPDLIRNSTGARHM